MPKFPLRMSIVVPACYALAGCLTDGTSPKPGVGGEGFLSISPRGAPTPLGGVLDPSSSTDFLANCVAAGDTRDLPVGSASRNYSISGSGGISATNASFLGIAIDASTTKSVTVSADDMHQEVMVGPYRSIKTMGQCDLSKFQNPNYVRAADKATTLKYTLNDQAGAAAQVDLCKKVGNIGAGGNLNIKVTYSNQVQYTSPNNVPVYYEVLLAPVPTGWTTYVDLKGDPKSIPSAYPYTFDVRGPDSASPNYKLELFGPDNLTVTPILGINRPTPVPIGGYHFW
jgi:hypothetical protein